MRRWLVQVLPMWPAGAEAELEAAAKARKEELKAKGKAEAAAGALRNLTYNNNVNRNAMAAAGAVPILVDMCKQGENEMSQMHAAALLKNLTSSPQCIAAVAKELGLGDPNAASKTDVDAEVDGLLHVSRAAAPAAPTSPTSPGSGRFKMAAKLVSQLTPKSLSLIHI